MNNSFLRRGVFIAIVAIASLTFTGCTKPIEGKYEDANGVMSIEFKSGKAYVGTMVGAPVETTYTIDGDKITVASPSQGNLVLTRNSDGTLSSVMGTFKKKG
jgi:uncharacterized lipoprotein YehR (DUF1307 family)